MKFYKYNCRNNKHLKPRYIFAICIWNNKVGAARFKRPMYMLYGEIVILGYVLGFTQEFKLKESE